MEKQLSKINEMVSNKEKILIKFDEFMANNPKEIIIDNNTNVTINEVSFTDGIISKLVINKVKFDDSEECMFIYAYIGNLEAAVTLTRNEDYVIEKDNRQMWIRKAENYDY